MATLSHIVLVEFMEWAVRHKDAVRVIVKFPVSNHSNVNELFLYILDMANLIIDASNLKVTTFNDMQGYFGKQEFSLTAKVGAKCDFWD